MEKKLNKVKAGEYYDGKRILLVQVIRRALGIYYRLELDDGSVVPATTGDSSIWVTTGPLNDWKE
jgi:hypothetical protein